MTSLAARQDIILEKLKELKEQLVTMKNNSRMCAKPAQNQSKSANNKNTSVAPPKGRCQPKVSVLQLNPQMTSNRVYLVIGQCPWRGHQLPSGASAIEFPVAPEAVEEQLAPRLLLPHALECGQGAEGGNRLPAAGGEGEREQGPGCCFQNHLEEQ